MVMVKTEKFGDVEVIADETIPDGTGLMFQLPDEEMRFRLGLDTPEKLARWMALNGRLIKIEVGDL